MSKHSLAVTLWSMGIAVAQTSVLNFNDGRFLLPFFAQGEVASIVLRIPGRVPDAAVAAGQRWPESLNDIGIVFTTEGDSRSGIPARIGSVRSLPYPSPGVTGTFTFVEFQVPFSANSLFGTQFGFPYYMKTLHGSDEVDSRPVVIVSDRIRLDPRCDRFYLQAPLLAGLDDCGTRLYFEDGTEVPLGRQLMPGDKIHAFATGFGQTDPPTADGAPFEANASPSIQGIAVWLEYRVNALPRFAFADEVTRMETAKVSVVPGSIGRYRIDFEIPPTPDRAIVSACGGFLAGFGGGVVSNATLTIRGVSSLGGAGLCLQPNPPNPPPRRIP